MEPVNLNKIVKAVERCSEGLKGVDTMLVATKTISGLHNGSTTAELDNLSIKTAASFVVSEPNYSKLAARLLSTYIAKEVANQDIGSFTDSVRRGYELGLINEATWRLVDENSNYFEEELLKEAITLDPLIFEQDHLFEYFGLRTVYDRYLLCYSETRKRIETPQYFFLRVACGLCADQELSIKPEAVFGSENGNSNPARALASKSGSSEFGGPKAAMEFYRLISSLKYLPSSPTLFNSGTRHTQMSSCYLLDSPEDDLGSIYGRYADVAKLSKHAGGIGLSYTRVRSQDSLIKGTNGKSNGIVPWLKVLDSSVSAVNQGGRRKGAACVYLETWHADIEAFLELKDNTGDEARRTHNLNLANWIPDLFMRRVKNGWKWSLFDPKRVPHLVDLYGREFEEAYSKAEEDGLAEKEVDARDLYMSMLRTLAQTGNGWMTFKDASNEKCNQTGDGRVVHLSNLCTEILEVTNQEQTAVCNLGSVNVSRLVKENSSGKLEFDFEELAETVAMAVPFLDRVIDINYYPIPEAKNSNQVWRPVGLGLMGLQDVFFKLRLEFDSPEALELSRKISEEIYYSALKASCLLAERHGPHPEYENTKISEGFLQMDLWGDVLVSDPKKWEELRKNIAEYGLRNSLLIAVAPTATIASIAGCYECIEPQVSNLFKRGTLSGEFIQINTYLVRDLQALGLWNEEIQNAILEEGGSIQSISKIPEDICRLYRMAWELSMKSLIDLAVARGPFVDQSQSLNLFAADPNLNSLSAMYMYAWESGIKTTYYLRSKAATRIKSNIGTGSNGSQNGSLNGNSSAWNSSNSSGAGLSGNGSGGRGHQTTQAELEALQCSLENPESCESCQ